MILTKYLKRNDGSKLYSIMIRLKRRNRNNLFVGCVLFFSLFLFFSAAEAQDEAESFPERPQSFQLPSLLKYLSKTHDRIKAAEAGLESADYMVGSAKSDWYPRIEVAAHAGGEEVDKADGGSSSQRWRNKQSIKATQLLYDFGETGGNIEVKKGARNEAEARLEQARQEVLVQGITSYLMLIRYREMLKYSTQSEESIREISGMQEALVKRGAGLSYEDLQAKGQLAGAEAHRIEVERALDKARNNFKSLFGFEINDEELDRLSIPEVPVVRMPSTLEQALEIARDRNPLLVEKKYVQERFQGELRSRRSAFYPKFELMAEAARKENNAGDPGVKTEGRAGVDMTYTFYTGLGDFDKVKSAKADIRSAKKSYMDINRKIEEEVSNSWQDLKLLRQNVELYNNQSNITFEFLRLIKKKKALGSKVSLLNILVGERDYIAATSSKVAAEIDSIIAAFTLLYHMGQIDSDVVAN